MIVVLLRLWVDLLDPLARNVYREKIREMLLAGEVQVRPQINAKPQMITPSAIVPAVSPLSDDATLDDAFERLFILHKIERGLKDAWEGRKGRSLLSPSSRLADAGRIGQR